MKASYTPPSFKTDAFHCPHCGVYSHQIWYTVTTEYKIRRSGLEHGFNRIEELKLCFCQNCEKYSLWVNEKMLYPVSSIAPLSTEDMPENVKEEFLEARNVVNASPRSAAALLRLALQKLMVHLGERGKRILMMI